jgi:hypothetical protein
MPHTNFNFKILEVKTMNKRIQELAEEAGMVIVDDEFSSGGRFAEKFAELIIKECIAVTDDLVNHNADGTWTSNELYTDYNGALFEVKRKLQETFGLQ